MRRVALLCASVWGFALGAPAGAEDLFHSQTFSALASDRSAAVVGDLLTVLVYENASASNSASTNTEKKNAADVLFGTGGTLDESASVRFGGSSDNAGSTTRSGKMLAHIGATVDDVLPNGDLIISGDQELVIAGEHSRIRLHGRVRRSDISAANTVLSSRIADARIEYDGKGFAARGARPGVVSRIFSLLGLM